MINKSLDIQEYKEIDDEVIQIMLLMKPLIEIMILSK